MVPALRPPGGRRRSRWAVLGHHPSAALTHAFGISFPLPVRKRQHIQPTITAGYHVLALSALPFSISSRHSETFGMISLRVESSPR
jgi:hypothetical protein